MTDLQKQRLLELLSDQAVFGLNEDELMELERLKKQSPDWEDDVSLELAAAAINLSHLEVNEELPANLRMRIFANADDFFESLEEPQKFVNSAPAISESGAAVKNVVEAETRISPWQWLGWAFAAVACIALAITLLTRPENKTPEIVKTPPVTPTPQAELSIGQKREQLMATATDKVIIPLTNPKNEKEVVGDMVWSNAEQKGFARFTNLPVNDAGKETYQLWIVDETQDAKTPLSGGVFNVSGNGEVIVPVNAQLQVKKPKMIAVTVEKPGGVVVSKQQRIVALAKI